MPNDFIVRPKCTDKKEDKSITMTIRLERELQEQYDDLSAKSGRSRNELMCMALRYALDNLKLNKIAARWLAKAVAQLSFSQ